LNLNLNRPAYNPLELAGTLSTARISIKKSQHKKIHFTLNSV